MSLAETLSFLHYPTVMQQWLSERGSDTRSVGSPVDHEVGDYCNLSYAIGLEPALNTLEVTKSKDKNSNCYGPVVFVKTQYALARLILTLIS